MNKISRGNPYCSILIIFSVETEKTEKRIFEPSSGGKGMRLKAAKSTFQKTTMIHTSKKMAAKDPERVVESDDQLLKFDMMAYLVATGTVKIFATNAAASAIRMFDPGPPSATKAGPHF